MKPRRLAPIMLGIAVIFGPMSAHAGSDMEHRPDVGEQGHVEPGTLTPAGSDMPTIGGNLGNQNYSDLTQINKDNLRELGPTWRTHISAVEPVSDETGSQTHPIVVDGVIYMDTPSGGVIAVDGATGVAEWKWSPEDYETAGRRRGVAVGEGKVYTMADGMRVVALDKDTGEEAWVAQPESPDGEPLGSDAAPGTRYHDGLVYIHTNNGDRGSISALDASDGSVVWTFYGGPERGIVFTDVNGNSVDAGATWGPVLSDGTECNLEGGATPWMHGAIDPELGMYYMTFGNPRNCNSSQDGSQRPGDNLFSSTMVAVDMKTGEYKWHFQSIPHDVWDMDNVHPMTLADVEIDRETRKVVFYGSKSGHQFVLDRANGQPALPVEDRPMPTDSREEHSPTQPFPQHRVLPNCLVWESLDEDNIPGDPWRGVPNYNGYQPDEDGDLVFNPDSYIAADEPYLNYPQEYGADHRQGCMYDPHWDQPVLSTTSQNGGGDFSSNSYSHSTNMVYFPYGTNPVAHWREASRNGHRATGQYQTGGILAYDASTGEVQWENHSGLDMSHGQSPLTTASDLLFVGQNDGTFLTLDAATGDELWSFDAGSGISGAPITYTIDGEQYVAVFAAGHTNPYGGSVTQGDSLWAFKLGGNYTTESGSAEAPDTAPLTIRRPVGGDPVEGDQVDNTVYLARADRTTDEEGAQDSTDTDGMSPTHIRVPVGTSVTFLNPGEETFPNFPNEKPHCATQFFEGLFNPKLDPGESFEYTFDRAGDYFFNDCTDPRPTGKIEVYATPGDLPGALQFRRDSLDFTSSNGNFTGVHGVAITTLEVPQGHRLDEDSEVLLQTPLSESPVEATRTFQLRDTLYALFPKADLDNNLPEGDDVSVTLEADFIHDGAQKRYTSTATPDVVK